MNWIEELREACVGEKPRTGSMTKQMPKGVNTRLPAFACVFHRHTATNKVRNVVHLVLKGVFSTPAKMIKQLQRAVKCKLPAFACVSIPHSCKQGAEGFACLQGLSNTTVIQGQCVKGCIHLHAFSIVTQARVKFLIDHH
jgi:hypothetical protein